MGKKQVTVPHPSDDENFPKGSYNPDFQFKKIRFKMPELQGAASYGRLMYVVAKANNTVYLVWVYTHKEFPKRPEDGELRKELMFIEQENVVKPDIDSDR